MNYTEKSKDVSYNIGYALNECKKNGENSLVFEKGEYHIFPERAMETVCSMSNHSNPGFKRCVFLLEDFENFTIDGNGSTFILEEVMTPVILSNCKNITVKNCEFISKRTANAQFEVVRSGEDWADLKVEHGKVFIYGGEFYEGADVDNSERLRSFNEYDQNCKIVDNLNDYWLKSDDARTPVTQIGDGLFHVEKMPMRVPVGHKLVMTSRTRCAAGIFVSRCENISIENVCVYSGVGMAFIAQNTDTITLDKFSTKQLPGRCCSANADGTHFVHCKGKITVKNSYFEGQMDDALNIHSIYLKIIDKTENSIIVKYVHGEQKGIDIVGKGSIVEISDPETLIPDSQYEVLDVNVINIDTSEIFLKGDISKIRVGDIADEISYVPEVLFENCTVKNNRARGMLLASRGKIEILNNNFSTTGSAIKFESDGKFWYESGSTKNVLISGNIFENCSYVRCWGNSVIYVAPREKAVEGKYYHGKIEVSGNTFKNCCGNIATLNNIEHFIFKDNKIEDCEKDSIIFDHCGKVERK